MRVRSVCLSLLLFACTCFAQTAQLASERAWPTARAAQWYAGHPWLVGANYVPKNAINQLEMWQADTFDPAQIDRELGWAESIGMNTMRVFLHDLLWQQDAEGFRKRIDQFLAIAERHHIRPMFVLFDSVWNPNPRLGPQHPPIPGVHNSGWVQSPGLPALMDRSQWPRLKTYVQGVVGAFANDPRVLAWDLWNEPNNRNIGSYDDPETKLAAVEALLPQVFEWARSANPVQPVTSGVWDIDFTEILTPIQRIQLRESDVISFHNYSWPEQFRFAVEWLRRFGRPILCTEYMARAAGSTFDNSLPIAKEMNVAAINWGLVAGKTQTYLPWESWQHPYIRSEPPIWFHEIFREDGKPYRQAEVDLIRKLTGKK